MAEVVGGEGEGEGYSRVDGWRFEGGGGLGTRIVFTFVQTIVL